MNNLGNIVNNGISGNMNRIPWDNKHGIMLPAGLSALPWLCEPPKYPTMIIVPTVKDIQSFSSAWKLFWGQDPVLLTPVPLDADSVKDRSVYLARGQALKNWDDDHPVLVTTPGGVMGPLRLSRTSMTLKKGQKVNRVRLIKWLLDSGYSQSDVVWSPGQFASRGFILDIYDPAHVYPLRLELFDEDIEQIRSFRSESQKSVAMLDELDINAISDSENVDISRFLRDDTRMIFFEAEKLQNHGQNYKWLWETLREPGTVDSISEWTDIYLKLSRFKNVRIDPGYSSRKLTLNIESPPVFKGNMSVFTQTCTNWIDKGYTVHVFSSNEAFIRSGEKTGCKVHGEYLSGGVFDKDLKTIILSDLELLGATVSGTSDNVLKAPGEWTDMLSPGDHVIHDQNGVALFKGLEQVDFNGSVSEMLVLEFADSKRLMIPVVQFYHLTPVNPLPGEDISLDILGGKRWKRSVEKEREKARQEALHLTKLYARREVLDGYGFSADNDLTEEFENSFPFVETADQLRAIESVKKDMELPVPMDRLIVGDVGYGKTEVAMRAAFKAVQDGKQVAFLVPTTILAQQHLQTFEVRFAGFPVNIAAISRFLSSGKQKTILQELSEGKIDIIIGTQRLLQKDIKFRDLGLLIIDEEHRFGVSNKEKLKDMNELVDVLTLSATPIPRTLSMSLRALKDFSSIKTPPENRMPVVTFVGPWNKPLVHQSIGREIDRGGQVFYVHNRIKTIKNVASVVSSMFPDSSVAIAHGQMREKELEQTMLDFYDGRTDILVCTTIIESGLDIGKANTLIVDDSHEMGMAQLYQLRGRIGRRSETAYAFFLYPEDQTMSRITTERLEAIASVSDPGGGYDLALNDLSVRGSGDVLGTRQHGRLSRITSGHYYKFLDEEVRKLKGEYFNEPEIEVGINTTIPSNYIPQETVRITIYRRLMRSGSIEEIDSIAEEIRDRFGRVPLSIRCLLEVCRLRILARDTFISFVKVSSGQITVSGSEEEIKTSFTGHRHWLIKKDRAVGPGSIDGLQSLQSVIVEHKKAGKVQ